MCGTHHPDAGPSDSRWPRFFQDGVCGDHLPRNEIRSDAEVLKRALRLRSPELVGRN